MILHSGFPEVHIPEIPVHEALFNGYRRWPNRTCLVHGITNKSYTFSEVEQLARTIASGLYHHGLRRGDRVLLYGANSMEYALMVLGVLTAGGTVTTANPAYTKYELQHQVKDSNPKFIYTTADKVDIIKEIVTDIPPVNMTVITDTPVKGFLHIRTLMTFKGSNIDLDTLAFNVKEDIAMILYSSGTTGLPKGVMLSHYNITANMFQTSYEGMRPKDIQTNDSVQETALLFLPMYHGYGLCTVLLSHSFRGDKIVIMPGFSPEPFLQSLQTYKVSLLRIVPPVAIFLAKSPLVAKYDLSSIKIVTCAAAPLGKEVEEILKERLKVPHVTQGYGMTEAGVTISTTPPSTWKTGSSGVLIPNLQVKIVDFDTKQAQGPHGKGEIWIRGPNIMVGYLNNPTATMETIDRDGWCHTGDIGYYDEDGFLYVVDRLKELIKYKGFQVAPAELEAVILNHPKVGDAGVIGIPDQKAGELPKAFVVPKAGMVVTEKEIHDHIKAHLAPFKQLRGGVQIVKQIPKSPSGKILRRKLREQFLKSHL